MPNVMLIKTYVNLIIYEMFGFKQQKVPPSYFSPKKKARSHFLGVKKFFSFSPPPPPILDKK
jgi:hypothetical protein